MCKNVKTCVLNMHYFWNVKNMYFKNVKTMWKMHFLKQIWSFVLFSFCIWFYVFAPGSPCFAIDILNRSAICTVHFRSIWTAPLRFSTCRSWAGSKVTATKKLQQQNWIFKCFFSHLFTFVSHFFTFFSHFQNAFFFRIFSHVFHIFN